MQTLMPVCINLDLLVRSCSGGVRGWGWSWKQLYSLAALSGTFFSSSAHSKTECPKLHDHLKVRYTFTCISSIVLITDTCCYCLYFAYQKAKLTEAVLPKIQQPEMAQSLEP